MQSLAKKNKMLFQITMETKQTVRISGHFRSELGLFLHGGLHQFGKKTWHLAHPNLDEPLEILNCYMA